MNSLDRQVAVIGGVAVATLLAGSLWFAWPRGDDPFADCRTSRVAGGSGAIGGPFTLVDEDGRTVTDKDVITRPSLVYFGYSFCPDVCPLDAARNAEVAETLKRKAEIGVNPTLLLVEDDQLLREQLARTLEQQEFSVVTADGVAEARRVASDRPPAYAVVEANLIDGTGLEVIENLRESQSDLHAVVLTDDDSSETVPTFEMFGEIDYLVKPTSANEISKALLSKNSDLPSPLENLFITIDPERDTAAALKEYTAWFADDMLGLTGSAEQVAAAAKAYRVLYRKDDSGGGDYLMSHTTFTYLVLPETGFVEFFNRDVPADEMARRVGCFIDAA